MTRHDTRPRLALLPLLVVVAVTTTLPTITMAWSSPSSSSSVRSISKRIPSSAAASSAATSPLFSSTTDTVDQTYYNSPSSSATSEELEMAAHYANVNTNTNTNNNTNKPPPGAKITLTRWLSAKVQDYPELRDVESLHLSIQMACKTISNLIHSSSTSSKKVVTTGNNDNNLRDNSMKRLDQISKNVLQNALRFTGRLRVVEAPWDATSNEEGPRTHQPGVTIAYALDQYGKDGMRQRMTTRAGLGGSTAAVVADAKLGEARRLAACFDPLDGSGNADAAICTGTVFGVFDADGGFKGGETPDLRDAASLSRAVLQPGNQLLAAGYCLYSSTTMLVFSLGGGTHGFTLDKSINEFVLTHPNMKIPERGNIYSANEAYSEGWDEKFKGYLKRIKTGRGRTGQRYTQRYIGSMVGDVHRTLMYGGIFCCPSDNEVHPKGNLQLVYKSAPMAYILEHAGGKAIADGNNELLSVQPTSVHERNPCFMGSPEDVDELTAHLRGGA